MAVDRQRIRRYRRQSFQYLDSAFDEMRGGRWSRTEDFLWGSLTLAVKGVALSRAEQIEGQEAVREYATQLGLEHRDRRIRDAFTHLSTFADWVERVRELRYRVDRLVPVLEDISSAVERLWEMVPQDDPD
ncbi:MAG: hypothetical protein QF714_06235 [Dehalococcoidia bacterium]|jgi:hypothetical protein|nr:hypothetical protein [Dehalococcoidia bacterium]MDP6227289.1 hypothetical protein [Dehalococcoidia bacterium]MDP7083562.1 hypothetical protein [Dehalococcoidia bacterium]MDP7199344.1 hypothetical protein [Dehalococcoidia bacterium]HJN88447.1 hypothetical protein [Dehalococcoidia bacterium]|tara:strand:- start:88 stop:480 length:393 start_codon:yes stop_codon:yes gene_type:complete